MARVIKNFWKQFAEWGTALEGKLSAPQVQIPDIFALTRFRLAIFYFVITFIVLVPFGLWSDSLMKTALYHQLTITHSDPVVAQSIVSAVLDEWDRARWAVRIGGTIAIFALSYLMALITLRPLKRAFESQRQFLANASHELRTPLTVMKTNLEVALMRGNELSHKESAETIRSALDELNRMTETLQVLLSFPGYDKRAEKLIFSKIALCEAVQRAVRFITPIAEARQIHVSFVPLSPPAVIKGNSAALEEMILNLLKNAIAHMPSGGTVRVTVSREKNKFLLTVKDNGIGIKAGDLPYIFEPFYRSLRSTKEKPGGHAGLGLAIVREIVKLHRAKIAVESMPGEGTSFFISFAAA